MSASADRRRAPLPAALAWLLAAVVVPGVLEVAAADAPTEWDGLKKQSGKRVALLYTRPDSSLAGYKRVRIERLRVSFDKNWKPNQSRDLSRHLSAEDFDNIKYGVMTGRRGWLPKEQCINCWPAEKLHGWLKRRKS